MAARTASLSLVVVLALVAQRSLRQHLADDLDTPKALAALDGWARFAVEQGGDDASAPGLFADAVDALLGVPLR